MRHAGQPGTVEMMALDGTAEITADAPLAAYIPPG
jgi:hypothetical protein